MSSRRVERALARMADGGVLRAERAGASFALYPNGDRRRRPIVRLSAAEVRSLESTGLVRQSGDAVSLTDAGRARLRREASSPGEAFLAQHKPIVDRAVVDADGDWRRVRGHDVDAVLRRLASLRDSAGEPWLNAAELAAAARLRGDWELGQRGLVRGSDWTAPPNASGARAPGNRAEHAVDTYCDARRRVEADLSRLAPPLRRVVESVCLNECGLEALERGEAWPARSGKLALKLALAQVAAGV